MKSDRNNLHSDVWLHRGSIIDAIEWADHIEEAPNVGYVYLLALSNGHTKVGATAYFPRRLGTHRSEFRRFGITAEHCLVTRPHFNFWEIERAVMRQFVSYQVAGEVLDAPISVLAHFVESQELVLVAPADYSLSRHRRHDLLMKMMADISQALDISPHAGLPRYVQSIMERHINLGRETGLSEREATLNALAVIEAHTGLKLSALRNVLMGVA